MGERRFNPWTFLLKTLWGVNCVTNFLMNFFFSLLKTVSTHINEYILQNKVRYMGTSCSKEGIAS